MNAIEFENLLIGKYLSKGCDERIYPDSEGLLKYWIDPTNTDLINRGSCTCNPLNKTGEKVIRKLLETDLENPNRFRALVETQTQQLKDLINYRNTDRFEIFYGPSGTDLVYLPIIFSHLLKPGKPILNIVSCPEELGSGTTHASKGQFHADRNQFEEDLKKGSSVLRELEIKVLNLEARNESGKIINHQEYIKSVIKSHPDHSVIVNLVYGSKSGIEDNLNIIDEVSREDVIWSVDMCQFRHSRKVIHRLLANDALVFLTGSKFYQAPPFCGAMLVSKRMYNKFRACDLFRLDAFHKIFSSYDFPLEFEDRHTLPRRMNLSLRLRWACAINEIQQFKASSVIQINKKIRLWNRKVNTLLEASPHFDLMPDQRYTNDTIISFRVKKDGKYLDHDSLKELHRIIATEAFEYGSRERNVFIGQPVAYGEKSFLRLAIGANNIQTFIQEDETAFELDKKIIAFIESKIALLA